MIFQVLLSMSTWNIVEMRSNYAKKLIILWNRTTGYLINLRSLQLINIQAAFD